MKLNLAKLFRKNIINNIRQYPPKDLFKSKGGITIIQLVVTIIILIILAAVVINLVIGKNGVIARADDGKEQWTRATEIEQLKIAYSACETDFESVGTPITAGKLGDELKNVNPDTNVEDFDMVNQNVNDYDITIDRNDETGYAKATFTQTQHLYIVALVQVDKGVERYNITYDANKGEGAPAKQVKIKSQSLTLSNIQPTRKGYTFIGWSKSNISEFAEYSGGQTYTEDEDLNLFAVWKINEYTITYNLQGGDNASSNPTGYDIDTPTFTLSQPTKVNNIFTGWTGSDVDSITKTVTIKKGTVGNKTYQANWELAYYAVDDSYYALTLNEALENCKPGSKIKVLRNANETQKINNITSDLTLDLAGKTLNMNTPINISNGIKLTIDDSGDNNEYTGKIFNNDGIAIINNGTLQLGKDDGNIISSPYIEAKTLGIETTNGNLLFYDGNITAEKAINGDAVTTPSTYYAMSNANTDNSTETVSLQMLGSAVCRIGYRYYSTLQAAIDATPSGTYKEEKKEVKIADTLKSNSKYFFLKNLDGSLVSTNKEISNSVADSYYKIDLSELASSKKSQIKVNASISSEAGCDIGYAAITETTDAPRYDTSIGKIMYISGEVASEDDTTEIMGGKCYYLHLGYRKDSSGDQGSDTFKVNNISIDGTDINNKMIDEIVRTPILTESASNVSMLTNVTVTGQDTVINETKNIELDIGDHILTTSGENAKIVNNGKLTINSKSGKGVIQSNGAQAIDNDTCNELRICNVILKNYIRNIKGNSQIENCELKSDYSYILYSFSGNHIINNCMLNNNKCFIKCYNSDLSISNCKINCELEFSGGSNFNINSCDINCGSGNYQDTVKVSDNAKLDINNSTLSNLNFHIEKTASLNLKNSSIEDYEGNTFFNMIENDGTTSIIKSKIKLLGEKENTREQFISLIENNGKLTIGEDDGTIENDSTIIESNFKKYYPIKNNGEFDFYDGIISGIGFPILGSITNYDKKYSIVDNYNSDKNKYELFLSESGVCEINGKTYKTLDDAIESINENENQKTIKMINSTKNDYEINLVNKDINIDLNGYNVEDSKKISIDEGSKLKINDTSSNNKPGNLFISCSNIENNGELTIGDITLQGEEYDSLITNNKTLNLNNCNVLSNNTQIFINNGNMKANTISINGISINKTCRSIGIKNINSGYVELTNVESDIEHLIENENEGKINIIGGKFTRRIRGK